MFELIKYFIKRNCSEVMPNDFPLSINKIFDFKP